MKTTEFCYWLQGYFEIHGEGGKLSMNEKQVQIIRNHLNLVFKHDIDPSYPGNPATMQAIHDGTDNLNTLMRC